VSRPAVPRRILQYLLLLAACGAIVTFVVAGLLESESGASTSAEPVSTTSTSTPTASTGAPLAPAPVGGGTESRSIRERLLPPAKAASSGAKSTTTIQPETSTDDAASPVASPTTTGPGPTTTTISVQVPASTTSAPGPPGGAAGNLTAPIPPASRFVAGDVAALFATGGGDDPVGTAREILRRSGPLAAQFADDPIVIDKLGAALDGALLVGASDFANRILPAINAATDAIASEQADDGTGLCLIVGPGYSCVQVAALNHTFSALPHRPRLDTIVDAYGSASAASRISDIADLHFTGNAWSLMREAHSAVLTAELRNAWINAGIAVAPNTEELTANAVFLIAYLDAARLARVETWNQLMADGVGVGIATTWNQLVAAYATTDPALWNIAFLADATSIVELTGATAGLTRPPL